MNYHRKGIKIGAALLSATLSIGTILPVNVFASSEAKEKLEEKKQQINQLRSEQEDMTSDLEGFQDDLTDVLDEIDSLKSQIADKETGISNLEEQIAQLENLKTEKQEAVAARMQYVYENGEDSPFKVLLGAKSFSDFLNRAEYLTQMAKYDKNIIAEYTTACADLEGAKSSLSDESSALAELQSQSESNQSKLESMISSTNTELVLSKNELETAMAEAESLEEQIRQQNAATIAAQAEEIQAKLAAEQTEKVEKIVPYEEEVETQVEMTVADALSQGLIDQATADQKLQEAAKSEQTNNSSNTGEEETSTGEDTSSGSQETESVSNTNTASASDTKITVTTTQTVTKYKSIYEEAWSTGAYNYPDYNGRSYAASASERELLAALIYCEAGGESYEGQKAVGSVVMNRVYSSYFPNTISGVIYDNGQFTPVRSGRLALVLANKTYTDSCVRAANEVISGSLSVKYWYFYAASSWTKNYAQKIGNAVFF